MDFLFKWYLDRGESYNFCIFALFVGCVVEIIIFSRIFDESCLNLPA